MFWQYDARLGRRWNQDPKPNPSISNYACFAGNPIMYSDPLGDTIKVTGTKKDKRKFIRQANKASGNKFKVDDDNNLVLKKGSYNKKTTKRKSGDLSQLFQIAIEDDNVLPF
jgi:hypothetical protein